MTSGAYHEETMGLKKEMYSCVSTRLNFETSVDNFCCFTFKPVSVAASMADIAIGVDDKSGALDGITGRELENACVVLLKDASTRSRHCDVAAESLMVDCYYFCLGVISYYIIIMPATYFGLAGGLFGIWALGSLGLLALSL